MRFRGKVLFVLMSCLATALAMAVTRHDGYTSDVVEAADNKNSAVNQTGSEQRKRPDIHFDLSAIKRTAPDNIQSNGIFQSKTWYTPPPQQPANSLPPPPPSAPSLPFTFVGRMIDGNSVVLFLSRNDRRYIVKESDMLDNDYRLDKISDSFAVFTYLPMSIQQTLAFNSSAVGSSALSASASTMTQNPR